VFDDAGGLHDGVEPAGGLCAVGGAAQDVQAEPGTAAVGDDRLQIGALQDNRTGGRKLLGGPGHGPRPTSIPRRSTLRR
jgi:hypothetical protein